MRRAALGIIAGLLLVSGAALYFSGPDSGSAKFSAGVLLKTGCVLFLFWLAYDQVLRMFQVVPPWLMGAGLAALAAIIAFPRHALLVLGLFAVLLAIHYAGYLLRPLAKKKRRRPKPLHKNGEPEESEPKG